MTKEREEYLIKKVRKNWAYFGKINKEEQTDRIIDVAIDKNAMAFCDIKDDKMKTLDRCLKGIFNNGRWLKFVPVNMQTSEVIDIAMWKNPMAFMDIKDDKMKTVERCVRALDHYYTYTYSNGNLFSFVPDELKEEVEKELSRVLEERKKLEI